MRVRELHVEEFGRAAPVLLELRGHHRTPSTLTAAAQRQGAAGYRLVVAEEGGTILAVAGFRRLENLAFGRHLYVDDLVTTVHHRGRGAGTALLDHLDGLARAEGCAELHLDSGVAPERQAAHRRYFSHGMRIASYHFIKALEEG